MEGFEFLEHTADAKFRAFGKTLAEKFVNAALAMTFIITEPDKVEATAIRKIHVKSQDIKGLLYNWLEELLFLFDSDFFVVHKINNAKMEQLNETYTITATLVGDKFDEKKYELKSGIKAVTYEEMEITDDYVQVVVDI